jgi:hypothetical protein
MEVFRGLVKPFSNGWLSTTAAAAAFMRPRATSSGFLLRGFKDKDKESYYALYELTHWTKHERRLDRGARGAWSWY